MLNQHLRNRQHAPKQPAIAVKNVVSAIETKSKNPMPNTIVNERNRLRINPQMPLPGSVFPLPNRIQCILAARKHRRAEKQRREPYDSCE